MDCRIFWMSLSHTRKNKSTVLSFYCENRPSELRIWSLMRIPGAKHSHDREKVTVLNIDFEKTSRTSNANSFKYSENLTVNKLAPKRSTLLLLTCCVDIKDATQFWNGVTVATDVIFSYCWSIINYSIKLLYYNISTNIWIIKMLFCIVNAYRKRCRSSTFSYLNYRKD